MAAVNAFRVIDMGFLVITMTRTENKRGRPPKPAGEKAGEVFQIRLTADDKASWREAAERADLPLAAWIRDRLNKAAKREAPKG